MQIYIVNFSAMEIESIKVFWKESPVWRQTTKEMTVKFDDIKII